MSKILVPIANGFEEIEAISIIDICRRAGIEVVTAGVEDKILKGAHNIKGTSKNRVKLQIIL